MISLASTVNIMRVVSMAILWTHVSVKNHLGCCHQKKAKKLIRRL